MVEWHVWVKQVVEYFLCTCYWPWPIWCIRGIWYECVHIAVGASTLADGTPTSWQLQCDQSLHALFLSEEDPFNSSKKEHVDTRYNAADHPITQLETQVITNNAKTLILQYFQTQCCWNHRCYNMSKTNVAQTIAFTQFQNTLLVEPLVLHHLLEKCCENQ